MGEVQTINFIENLNLVWTICVAIGGFIIYNFIPYIKTKIFTYEYYNLTTCFYLIEYELIGTFVAHVLAIVMVIIVGESTWSYLVVSEYFVGLGIFTFIYICGIALIVKIATEKGKKKYIINAIIGMFIYGMIAAQFILLINNKYEEEYNAGIYSMVICFILFQILVNIKYEKIKNVKYIVKTQKKKYETLHEPTKRGKYYFIRITDKKSNEIKRIQLPEDKIEKIEYIIEKLEEVDINNSRVI